MTPRILFIALLALFAPRTHSQSDASTWVPFYQAEYNDLGERTVQWGWLDTTGAVVRPAALVAGRVERYAEGRAVACLDVREDGNGLYRERCGFLDEGGAWVVEPIYDRVEPFQEGRARVNRGASPEGYGGVFGFIDRDGVVVIPIDYDWADSFSDGLVLVSKEDEDGGWAYRAFLDPSGREAFVLPDSVTAQEGFREERAPAHTGAYPDYQYGFLDRTGAWAIPPRFSWAGSFAEGLAPVTFQEGGVKRAGFVDTTGALVLTLPLPVNQAQSFSEGLAVVGVSHRGNDGRYATTYGYVDRTGAFVVELELEAATPFRDGRAMAARADGQWVVLDASGAEVAVVPGLYAGACDDFGGPVNFHPFVYGVAAFQENLCSDVGWTRGYVGRDGHLLWDARAVSGGTY